MSSKQFRASKKGSLSSRKKASSEPTTKSTYTSQGLKKEHSTRMDLDNFLEDLTRTNSGQAEEWGLKIQKKIEHLLTVTGLHQSYIQFTTGKSRSKDDALKQEALLQSSEALVSSVEELKDLVEERFKSKRKSPHPEK